MSTSKLHISEDLSLPLDAATQTFAFIARKGAGKTYAAGKLTELLLTAGVQCVVLDTVGNWYGLRLAADGKGQGFDVPVFGGLRGDIPLEATGGELIADIVVDTGRSLILDVSQFSLADRKRFATAFGERLWRRKKGEAHPSPLMLVIEESQLIIPQNPSGDTARMVGIYEEIIRLGRNYGIGCTMISQRPQSVNKEVLNQTECLFVGQVNGAQERKALREWVTHQGMSTGLVDELPALPIGTMYVWSPQWLRILEKVKIAPKRTYDASATPKVGEKRVQRELKPLDLEDLKTKMAATIERAKSEDPKALRQRVAELQRQLATRPTEQKIVEKPVVSDKLKRDVEKIVNQLEKEGERRVTFAAKMIETAEALKNGGEQLKATGREFAAALRGASAPLPRQIQRAPVRPVQAHVLRREPRNDGDAPRLDKCARAILSVLSQYPEGCDAGKLTLLTGYRYSGSFQNALSALRTAGFIVGENTATMSITDAGLEQGPFEQLPEGDALVAYWLNHRSLSKCAKLILSELIAHPNGLDASELCERTNYTYSGSFQNALSELRTAGLLVGKNTETMRANDELLGATA
jgi:hypothetical protein